MPLQGMSVRWAFVPPECKWGSRVASPWFLFSMAVAQLICVGIGPHRKSGVIRKHLLPVDSECPWTIGTTIQAQMQAHNSLLKFP